MLKEIYGEAPPLSQSWPAQGTNRWSEASVILILQVLRCHLVSLGCVFYALFRLSTSFGAIESVSPSAI